MTPRLLFALALVGCTPAMHDAAVDASGSGSRDAGSHGDAAGGTDAAPISHAISIIVEPDGHKGQQLVDAIAAATTSVYVTMYELDDADILTALASRARAGTDVQVVLDSSATNKSFNMPAYTQLTTAGAKVVWSSSRFTYTHEKCVILDGATAWIMTMNLNTSSPQYNREYLAIDTDATDVAEATAIFKADHALQAIAPAGPLVVANANARPDLVALIDAATTSLDVEGEEFSDSIATGVVKAVARAAQRGVVTHVVIANSTLDSTSVSLAKSAGAKVVMTGPTSGNGNATHPYIHAKAIVIDCATPATCARGFVGSENFSTGSLTYNRELGVIFDVPAELARVKAAIDHDFAAGVAQ